MRALRKYLFARSKGIGYGLSMGGALIRIGNFGYAEVVGRDTGGKISRGTNPDRNVGRLTLLA